jgi:hypothetical protein
MQGKIREEPGLETEGRAAKQGQETGGACSGSISARNGAAGLLFL